VDQIVSLQEYDTTTVYVDFSHLLEREPVLADAIQGQYYRFLPYLRRAVGNLVAKYAPTYYHVSPLQSTAGTQATLGTREFSIAFHGMPLTHGIRDLRMGKIGQLMSISGTVTRTSEVRPELILGTFKCVACGNYAYDVEQQFKYTEPIMCQNIECNNRKDWQLNIEESKFSDWQKVRIQENANEIPTGSMPRS
jgi:DNA replication licensing factor MCM6